MARAPACLANWTAKWPTPPAAPAISAVCPASSPPRSNSACHAVRPATGIPAACSWVTPSGFRAIVSADAVAKSAYPPLAAHPKTSSPSANPSARDDSIVPEMSLPSTAGSSLWAMPRLYFQSIALAAAAPRLDRKREAQDRDGARGRHRAARHAGTQRPAADDQRQPVQLARRQVLDRCGPGRLQLARGGG